MQHCYSRYFLVHSLFDSLRNNTQLESHWRVASLKDPESAKGWNFAI